MRSRLALFLPAATAALLILSPGPAGAQSLSVPDSTSFLVSGLAATTQGASQSSTGGLGFGVKGGWLYSSFSEAGESLDSRSGWEAGIFFGGNRGGVLGVMGELLYARKSFEEGVTSKTTNLDYFEIPVLLRLNIGSSNKNKGVIFYGLVGPVFDINLKAEQDGVDVSDDYEKLDIGILGGGGIEISRVLLEARYNWGLKNLLKNADLFNDELKTQSFALILGVRFN